MSEETVRQAAQACGQIVVGLTNREALAALALATAGILYEMGNPMSAAGRKHLLNGHIAQIMVATGAVLDAHKRAPA